VLLCLKMETDLFSEVSCFLKEKIMDIVTKEKVVSVTFSCAVFSGSLTCDDLVVQALVLLCRVHFRVMWFGEVWFSALYAKLRQPHTFKHQI